jgi:Protein of unknown function (DUF2971)
LSASMRAYKFLDDRYLVENLTFKRLKVSKPTKTNDPFEMSPFQFRDETQRNLYKTALDAHTRNRGFVSFSATFTSPSMWANYASDHRGACLGFQVNAVAGSSSALTEIDYVERFREFDSRALKVENVAILERELGYAMSTKSAHWSYEEEYRAFTGDFEDDTRSKITFLPFDRNLELKEVILGWKSAIDPFDIAKLVDPLQVKIYRAQPSVDSFAMCKKELPSS